jgi:predicted secreted hydrolase
MKRRAFIVAPVLMFAERAIAAVADGYPPVTPDHVLTFPRDHGSHPEFRTEWWYITGWVADAAGAHYGMQVTFFRNRPRIAEGNPSAFAPRQLVFAHAALADPRAGRLRHAERAARTGFGLAGADEASTRVWIDEWSLVLADGAYRARIAAQEFALRLRFAPRQPLLLQGVGGYSRKGRDPREASYYYSQPQLAVTGAIIVADRELPVTGTAWLDHEWSSEYLMPGAVGWDWTGINFADGGALMAFRIRDSRSNTLWAGGSYREAGGNPRAFAPSDVRFATTRSWRSPRTGITYPVAMTLAVAGNDYVLEPLQDDQELDASASTGTIYWEGAVRALANGADAGHGYLELTGYGAPLRL